MLFPQFSLSLYFPLHCTVIPFAEWILVNKLIQINVFVKSIPRQLFSRSKAQPLYCRNTRNGLKILLLSSFLKANAFRKVYAPAPPQRWSTARDGASPADGPCCAANQQITWI